MTDDAQPTSKFPAWLRHAFAVEPAGEAVPTPRQADVAERVCREVVRRGLAMPALVALETARPLNFVAAQALHFFNPLVAAVTDADGLREFAAFLERRGSVDWLARRIGELSGEERR